MKQSQGQKSKIIHEISSSYSLLSFSLIKEQSSFTGGRQDFPALARVGIVGKHAGGQILLVQRKKASELDRFGRHVQRGVCGLAHDAELGGQRVAAERQKGLLMT